MTTTIAPNMVKLTDLIYRATRSYRKGPALTVDGKEYPLPLSERDWHEFGETPGEVKVINLDPEIPAELPNDVQIIDMEFMAVGVVMWPAHRQELVEAIGNGIFDADGMSVKLADGPSYIHLGGVFGDQGRALRFMAMGHAYELWQVTGPQVLGMDRDHVLYEMMLGQGFLYALGWKATD